MKPFTSAKELTDFVESVATVVHAAFSILAQDPTDPAPVRLLVMVWAPPPSPAMLLTEALLPNIHIVQIEVETVEYTNEAKVREYLQIAEEDFCERETPTPSAAELEALWNKQ